MNRCLYLSFLLALSACASRPKTEPVINRTCEKTPIMQSDLTGFNITPAPGKVTVLRIIRSSCPYCKEDLEQIGLMLKTQRWKTEQMQVILVAYRKEGVENRQTFDAFVRELAGKGFPIESVQIVYLDKTYPALLKSKTASGELIFEDWKAVPYSLVFAKNGRLAYRGHFTMNHASQDAHYDFLTDLQTESCPPAPAGG